MIVNGTYEMWSKKVPDNTNFSINLLKCCEIIWIKVIHFKVMKRENWTSVWMWWRILSYQRIKECEKGRQVIDNSPINSSRAIASESQVIALDNKGNLIVNDPRKCAKLIK